MLFWGLLLVILDFSINKFDLLPDGIGYVLVGIGCGGLITLSHLFKAAKTIAFILAVLWLIGFIIHGDLARFYGITMTVLNCILLWQILGGIAEFAMKHKRVDLATRAHHRRIAYVVIMASATSLSFLLAGSRNAGPIALLFVVALIVLMVMILHLIHRTKVELVTS